jgi:hypothetical protein
MALYSTVYGVIKITQQLKERVETLTEQTRFSGFYIKQSSELLPWILNPCADPAINAP